MGEELTINIDGERDKIDSIDESQEDSIILNYKSKDQIRPIIVPKEVIRFVRSVIDGMEVGVYYHSKYIYNKYIDHFKIKSRIIEDRLPILKKVLKNHNISQIAIENIMGDLDRDDKYSRMPFEEMIGLRQIKDSHYFRCYGAIRYLKERQVIEYTSKGGVYRLI